MALNSSEDELERARSASQVESVADCFEDGALRRHRHRLLCVGFGRMLATRATPCRCSGRDKDSYIWHNYRPLSEKLEDIIESVVSKYTDKDSIVVASAFSVSRYIELRGAPICRDQTLRLVMAALCVNAKYWDEGASFRYNNASISGRAGIPLEDFNRMELSLLHGLLWTLAITAQEYEEWAALLETWGEEANSKEHGRVCGLSYRNPSPLLSTDVVEQMEKNQAVRQGMEVVLGYSGAGGRDGGGGGGDRSPGLDLSVLEVREGGEGEEGVCGMVSSMKDGKGGIIMTRLVFADYAPPEGNKLHSSDKDSSLPARGTGSILRVGSFEGLGSSSKGEWQRTLSYDVIT